MKNNDSLFQSSVVELMASADQEIRQIALRAVQAGTFQLTMEDQLCAHGTPAENREDPRTWSWITVSCADGPEVDISRKAYPKAFAHIVSLFADELRAHATGLKPKSGRKTTPGHKKRP